MYVYIYIYGGAYFALWWAGLGPRPQRAPEPELIPDLVLDLVCNQVSYLVPDRVPGMTPGTWSTSCQANTINITIHLYIYIYICIFIYNIHINTIHMYSISPCILHSNNPPPLTPSPPQPLVWVGWGHVRERCIDTWITQGCVLPTPSNLLQECIRNKTSRCLICHWNMS